MTEAKENKTITINTSVLAIVAPVVVVMLIQLGAFIYCWSSMVTTQANQQRQIDKTAEYYQHQIDKSAESQDQLKVYVLDLREKFAAFQARDAALNKK